jgi:outer membrane protein assembly factor BamB
MKKIILLTGVLACIYCHAQVHTGQLAWKFHTQGKIVATPCMDGQSLYYGSEDGYVYALDAQAGRLIWKVKTIGDRYFPKGEIQKAALVTGDAVYFGSRDYNIYALNRSTGVGLWNMKEHGSWVIATPMEKAGNLYFGSTDGNLYAVRIE